MAASERAKILDEFQQRKKEAEYYRNRGAGGVAAALGGAPRPTPSADPTARKPPSGNAGAANRPQSAKEAQAKQQEQVGLL